MREATTSSARHWPTAAFYVRSQTKGVVFGALAGYQGFSTGFGTDAVGTATTETVIAVSVMILLADFALTTLFMPVGSI